MKAVMRQQFGLKYSKSFKWPGAICYIGHNSRSPFFNIDVTGTPYRPKSEP